MLVTTPKIQPAMADIRINYGRFLETQGQLDEALTLCRQVCRESPELEFPLSQLGQLHLEMGQKEASLSTSCHRSFPGP